MLFFEFCKITKHKITAMSRLQHFKKISSQILVLTAFCIFSGYLKAQDPVFSQFYATPLQLNPAFAGSSSAPFIALNYRAEQPAFQTGAAYSTFSASYDQYFKGIKSGIGLSLMADDQGQGILRKNYASLAYAYRVDINRQFSAKLGIEVGGIMSNLNWDKLVFLDQIDPISGSTDPSKEQRPALLTKTFFDVSAGMLVYGKGFHAGFSAKHLATPNEGFLGVNQNLRVGLPIRWTIHSGYEIITRKATRRRSADYITPNLLYVKQGDFGQVVGGAFGSFGPISAGLWYRHGFANPDALISMIGFRQNFFKIGYSYDFTINGLNGGGRHEVSLLINLDPDADKKTDLNDCFKMFR
jgi:type IX secretion system PorP/SprF family membrane protein